MSANTKNYYDEKALEYVANTANVDFSDLYERLNKYMTVVKNALDIGCGSGRDALYFANKGIEVTAIDFSSNIINEAKKINNHTNIEYIATDIENYKTNEKYDLIWANASLLHLKKDKLVEVLKNIKKMLSTKGYFYSCFKQGNNSEIDDLGRYFAYYDEQILRKVFENLNFNIRDFFISYDKTGRNVTWLNFVVSNFKG
ncbi:class I SAM-dependent methyltransferase [Francisella sp. LA112445]|uniref:class I SAM-dependent methyltransferase n=1 Tax=Francisella sp. LA112445 TaxID=1395624 RepID=UPI001788A397|nr:class I SAM-dependent methyltransferase [Francisella sp. LA112445]QIW10589.1 class I SAM-dependent methyltransferase [Francisella sp. LA112445]